MTRNVLLVGSTAPARYALDPAVGSLREAGCSLALVFVSDGSVPVGQDIRTVVRIDVGPGLPAGSTRPRRFTPRWARLVMRNRWQRLLLRRQNRALVTWRAVRRHQEVRDLAGAADAIVALDRYAVYSVWRLTRSRGTVALNGLPAAARWAAADHA